MNLAIVKSELFDSVKCDFWRNENDEVFMTINQLFRALGYASKAGVENILSRNEYLLDCEFSSTHKMRVLEGSRTVNREMRIFTEDGIYEVSFLSKTEKSKKFRQWVRKILKDLRKGELTLVPRKDSYMIEDPVERAKAWIKEREEKEALQIASVEKDKLIGELKPRADYAETILKNKGLVTVTQIAKDYGMSAQVMNDLLRKLKVQYKQGNQWFLYRKYDAKGYVHSETYSITKSNGMVGVTMNTKWTQKGRMFIYELLKCEGIVPIIEQELERV